MAAAAGGMVVPPKVSPGPDGTMLIHGSDGKVVVLTPQQHAEFMQTLSTAMQRATAQGQGQQPRPLGHPASAGAAPGQLGFPPR